MECGWTTVTQNWLTSDILKTDYTNTASLFYLKNTVCHFLSARWSYSRSLTQPDRSRARRNGGRTRQKILVTRNKNLVMYKDFDIRVRLRRMETALMFPLHIRRFDLSTTRPPPCRHSKNGQYHTFLHQNPTQTHYTVTSFKTQHCRVTMNTDNLLFFYLESVHRPT